MGRWLERRRHPVRDVLYPIVTGPVIAGLKAFLTGRGESYASSVGVSRVLPPAAERTTRMVTVRDDGGPQVGVQERRQLGFNVWAESTVNGELLARLLMAGVQSLPDGDPITFVDEVNGPFEVVDTQSDLLVVSGVTLAHYFFTARVSARGTDL